MIDRLQQIEECRNLVAEMPKLEPAQQRNAGGG
jgi:hypothetical protein